jgi:hypothetical protein
MVSTITKKTGVRFAPLIKYAKMTQYYFAVCALANVFLGPLQSDMNILR